ncbi:MAG: hypothetical protein AAGN66_06985 [Acidobacteriota bacterium]
MTSATPLLSIERARELGGADVAAFRAGELEALLRDLERLATTTVLAAADAGRAAA